EGKLGKLQSMKACGLWPRNDAYYKRNDWAGRLRVGDAYVLDSPINNAMAHHLNLMLFLAGPSFAESATVLETQAELFRARKIESFDTAAIRVKTSDDIKLLMLASHSSLEIWPPQIVVECSNGSAVWSIDRGIEVVDLEGRVIAQYSSLDSAQAMACMYERIIIRLANPRVFICSTKIATAHVDCVSRIHRSTVIRQMPDSELVELKLSESSHTAIRSLEHYFRQAFTAGSLLSEIGCPWADQHFAVNRGN
ncbi:MAG TPA: hypothetical protein VKC60_13885, partial [Opitutaceae bacterium]|nr:hypothetical protein [Opitutaceae bacterium]